VIAFAPENLGLPRDEVAGEVARRAAQLGLEDMLSRDPRTLSAGEQQRVLVAAVLAARPALLVADEPGAHLESAARARVLAVIRAEAARGMSVVWASQDAGELAAADRVLTIGEPPAVDLSPPGLDGDGGEARLTIRVAPAPPGDGPRVATRDALTIDVPARGLVALLGPNGVGKSVLLAAVAGAGATPQVEVAWRTPPERPPIYSGQYPEQQLFEEQVADELAFAAVSRGLARPVALARAEELLRGLGLEPRAFLERRLWTLSGGERRLAVVVAALIAPASLIVLDEPTAGLDPQRRRALAGLLRRLAASTPVLLATQDGDWAKSMGARRFELGPRGGLEAPSRSEKTD